MWTGAKSNFSLREIRFGNGRHGAGSPEERAIFLFYANRNERMSEWMDQPDSFPKQLWPNALNVAARARNPTVLFQCILAICGDLGSTGRERKRKEPSYVVPS